MMTGLQPGLFAVTVGIFLSILSLSLAGATDSNNAQAAAAAAAPTNPGSGEPISLVRRSYVPRFVGKRADEPSENDNSEAELNEIKYDVQNFVDYLRQIKYEDIGADSDTLSEESEELMGDFSESEGDVDNVIEDELVSQEDKRYQPTFVGKRGRYNPMFVGKRYNPMFVGKRYNPMFVGKRYNPMFVGKRYNPMFVGKRYNPMFVGKKYSPMFVGKRYNPMFVGKRYQPTFVGKRYQPTFVGKRYQPTFVGKRYTPQFVGKRYQPTFVGKRDLLDDSEVKSVEKRSVSSAKDETSDQTELLKRRKRSVEDEEYKRAWGTYTPWQQENLIDTFSSSAGPNKRFVAPEFIGRRDSLSSILSALDALSYTRNPSRSASKRFEAPMFIGKRPYTPKFVGKRAMRPMFVGKRDLYSPDLYSNTYSDTNWDTEQYTGGLSPELELYTDQLKH